MRIFLTTKVLKKRFLIPGLYLFLPLR